MLHIGYKIIELRKNKNWSQEDLAKEIASSRIMIGKYERDENAPSMEVIVKLAKAFNVSIDYMLGEGLNASYDKEMIHRLEEMESLPRDEKIKIFDYMDMVVRDNKARQAYATR
jgi:transcriptional regulator with XRE-family HTH domain